MFLMEIETSFRIEYNKDTLISTINCSLVGLSIMFCLNPWLAWVEQKCQSSAQEALSSMRSECHDDGDNEYYRNKTFTKCYQTLPSTKNKTKTKTHSVNSQ